MVMFSKTRHNVDISRRGIGVKLAEQASFQHIIVLTG